jgi:hypothetical protein
MLSPIAFAHALLITVLIRLCLLSGQLVIRGWLVLDSGFLIDFDWLINRVSLVSPALRAVLRFSRLAFLRVGLGEMYP